MKEITYNFIDKSKWLVRGEWDNEPDKIQWQDKETGYPCLIVRAEAHLCGYVGVTKNHPAFGKDYNDIDVSVHGGLTFAGMCSQSEHGICHIVEEGEDDHVYWLGFDCAHSGDYRPPTNDISYAIDLKYIDHRNYEQYRNIFYVKTEVASLAKQLKELENVS